MDNVSKELAQEALSLLRGSKAFALEQAPDLMREVLAWETAKCAIGFVVAATAALFVPRLYRASKKDGDAQVLVCMTLVVVVGFSFCLGYDAVVTFLQIRYAPKLFLLEYFAGLAK